jgi:hypothetical protein
MRRMLGGQSARKPDLSGGSKIEPCCKGCDLLLAPAHFTLSLYEEWMSKMSTITLTSHPRLDDRQNGSGNDELCAAWPEKPSYRAKRRTRPVCELPGTN